MTAIVYRSFCASPMASQRSPQNLLAREEYTPVGRPIGA